MPGDVVNWVAANVRGLRETGGLSLSELARRSGLSKAALSQLEAGQGNPTVETLWSLAQALGVPFSDLTAKPAAPVVALTRARDVEWIAGDPVSSRLLHRLATSGVLEVHEIRIQPGRARRSEAHQRGLTEHVVIHHGSLRVGPVEAPVVLGSGDSASYVADVPHVYEGLEAGTGLILMHYPTPTAQARLEPHLGDR